MKSDAINEKKDEKKEEKEDLDNSKIENEVDNSMEKSDTHKFLEFILDHWITSTIMTIVTIYALFSDDVKMLFFTKPVDELFDIMTIVALVLFTFEIIVSSIVKEDYTCGFYFWLDFISTLSLIMDIGFVMDKLTGAEDFSASNAQ
jgi:branched-subunit amino acid transport protein AzlD